VTVTFSCVTHSAALVSSCPKPLTLTANQRATTVSRTIVATDGGVASINVGPIKIDRSQPSVKIVGARNRATYTGSPPARCSATDDPSGIASCTITRHSVKSKSRTTETITATATNRAGSSRSVRIVVYVVKN
jgi:hypothetical protein